MERTDMPWHGPQWKCNEGYIIDEETGMAKICAKGLCTLHFYHAYPGDKLARYGIAFTVNVAIVNR